MLQRTMKKYPQVVHRMLEVRSGWLRFWKPVLRRELALVLIIKVSLIAVIGLYLFSDDRSPIEVNEQIRSYYSSSDRVSDASSHLLDNIKEPRNDTIRRSR